MPTRKFAHTFSDHIVRYAFALDYCYRKDVLDVGSRDGFGAHLISWVSNSISQVDLNETYLQFAEMYLKPMAPVATYHVCDLEKDFPPGDWDVMTAFEVIEHVANPEFLVKNMASHLRPGGVLIFSVPHMVANHEHKVLFDEAKIKALIEQDFKIEEFYIQDKKVFSGRPRRSNVVCYVGVATKK